jgi:hypothetical protein
VEATSVQGFGGLFCCGVNLSVQLAGLGPK